MQQVIKKPSPPSDSEQENTSIVDKERKDKPFEKEYPKIGQGSIVNGKYKILIQIGQGSFGNIYKACELDNEQETQDFVAVKFEKRDDSKVQLLVREIKLLLDLKNSKEERNIGIPQIKFYGRDEFYNYYMAQYLGPNLEQIFQKNKLRFSILSCLRIFEQVIQRLMTLHGKHIMHRDLKPENLCIGKNEEANIIYLIDFGLSKYYWEENAHIGMTQRKGLIGTARYASINSHNGLEQGRRDDIESLCYIVIYLAKGTLPWMNLYAEDKQVKYELIKQSKVNNSTRTLCFGLPEAFRLVLEHAKALKFEEKPNYDLIQNLITKNIRDQLIERKISEKNLLFEWEEEPKVQKKKHEKKIIDDIYKKMVDKPEQANFLSPDNADIRESPDKVISSQNFDKLQSPYSSKANSKKLNYSFSSSISCEVGLHPYQIDSYRTIQIRKPSSFKQIPIKLNLKRQSKSVIFDANFPSIPPNFGDISVKEHSSEASNKLELSGNDQGQNAT